MVDSRRDVAGQAGRSPSPSVQATMIGLMAILLWSLMTGLVRVVADAFGATLGSALIYTCGAVLLLIFFFFFYEEKPKSQQEEPAPADSLPATDEGAAEQAPQEEETPHGGEELDRSAGKDGGED